MKNQYESSLKNNNACLFIKSLLECVNESTVKTYVGCSGLKVFMLYIKSQCILKTNRNINKGIENIEILAFCISVNFRPKRGGAGLLGKRFTLTSAPLSQYRVA